jgi:hypothetical protein
MDPRIEKFINDLNDIHEAEYGDFMRKANQHIIELRNEFHHYHDPAVDKKIDQIQEYVQFNPTWMIESTRLSAIRDAKRLNGILNAQGEAGVRA